jgi:hypothetical protein
MATLCIESGSFLARLLIIIWPLLPRWSSFSWPNLKSDDSCYIALKLLFLHRSSSFLIPNAQSHVCLYPNSFSHLTMCSCKNCGATDVLQARHQDLCISKSVALTVINRDSVTLTRHPDSGLFRCPRCDVSAKSLDYIVVSFDASHANEDG